jgi:ABC-type uncharacterized transport system permease subunit
MSSPVFAIPAIILYLASGFFIGFRLFGGNTGKKRSRLIGIHLGLGGVALHAALLYQNIFVSSGINLGFFNAASLVAWTILLLLMLSALTKPVENLGIILLPLAALAIALELIFPSSHFLASNSPWGLRIHVLISLIAYALLTMASVQAVMLAIQDHHLHARHPGGFIRALPPLQTMESLLFEMIGIGFVLLTLSLFSGFLFLEDMFEQRMVHKSVLSIAAWFVFGLLLWGRYRFGWRGQKALTWTLVGFVVLMLAYFGSKAVLELILTQGSA